MKEMIELYILNLNFLNSINFIFKMNKLKY